MRTKIFVAAMSTALVISGGVAYAAVAASSPTGPTAVSKLCKKGTTSVYSKASCRTGDQAITLKGLVGPAGEAGPAGLPGAKGDTGPAGPAGEAAGLVRKCSNVVVNATYQARTNAQRQVTLEGLPPYVASSANLWGSNAAGTPTGLGITVAPIGGLSNGATEISYQVTATGFTGEQSYTLRICSARLSLS
jgi:hypothetical protein